MQTLFIFQIYFGGIKALNSKTKLLTLLSKLDEIKCKVLIKVKLVQMENIVLKGPLWTTQLCKPFSFKWEA